MYTHTNEKNEKMNRNRKKTQRIRFERGSVDVLVWILVCLFVLVVQLVHAHMC